MAATRSGRLFFGFDIDTTQHDDNERERLKQAGLKFIDVLDPDGVRKDPAHYWMDVKDFDYEGESPTVQECSAYVRDKLGKLPNKLSAEPEGGITYCIIYDNSTDPPTCKTVCYNDSSLTQGGNPVTIPSTNCPMRIVLTVEEIMP